MHNFNNVLNLSNTYYDARLLPIDQKGDILLCFVQLPHKLRNKGVYVRYAVVCHVSAASLGMQNRQLNGKV